MPSLKEIRKRIHSVKNTRQITRAMKMISAAKLRRSQDAILRARPYAYKIFSILLSLADREGIRHPLLEEKPEKRIRIITIAGDRGLCGAFNANVIKTVTRFIQQCTDQGTQVALDCVGKRSYEYFKSKIAVENHYAGILQKPDFSRVERIGMEILGNFLAGQFDALYVVYNEFKSAIQQTVKVERFIPIQREVPGSWGVDRVADADRFKDYLFEPGRDELLNQIIPRHFVMQLYRAVLESVASEHGARMAAMENATKNASTMIDSLTLEYNKARQASITKELMEIVGGAEALRA